MTLKSNLKEFINRLIESLDVGIERQTFNKKIKKK